MIGCNDRGYLRERQYGDSSNLHARIELHKRFSTSTERWTDWVFDQLDLPATAHVLEVGCGPGTLWQENQERIPHGWRVTLSDFSPGMLADTQRNLASLSPQIIIQEADVQQLPFADASFDGVVANHMLYHVPDLDRGLHEIRRVLKPHGKLYAATNGLRHLSEIEWLLQRFDPTLKGGFALRVAFTLENGAAILARYFPTIELHNLADSLVVTEAEPLAAYICSGKIGEQIGARRPTLVAFLQHEIDSHGAIQITKSSGMFVAS